MGDKAYSRREIRHYLRQHGSQLTIPRQPDEHRPGPVDRAIYRLRSQVERLITRLTRCRRIATRDEKRAEYDQTRLLIAAIGLWW